MMKYQEQANKLMDELKDLFNVDSNEEALSRMAQVSGIADKINIVMPKAVEELKSLHPTKNANKC